MRHWRLATSGGDRASVEVLIGYFEAGFLQYGDLAETLQVMYLARAEMKSEHGYKYIQYLKETGRYNEDYDIYGVGRTL